MLNRICKICGKEFSVKSEKTNKVTCSQKCRIKNKKKLMHDYNRKRWESNPIFRREKLEYFKSLNGKYNKEKKVELQLKRLKRIKLNICKELGNKCSNCGLEVTEEKLIIFDLHHKNPNEKERYRGEWKLKNFDISKVVLLCANCHRLEHRILKSF